MQRKQRSRGLNFKKSQRTGIQPFSAYMMKKSLSGLRAPGASRAFVY